MICVAVSSVGEDKEEPTDLLKAHPNLVARSQNVFGSTIPGVVCIRQESAYDRIAKTSQAFVWRLAVHLVTVYARVKME